MRTVGFLLIFAGIAIGMFAFSMDTTVATAAFDRVNNIGLLNDKQDILFVAGVFCIMGSIFIAATYRPNIIQQVEQSRAHQFGYIVNSEPTNEQLELQRRYNAGQITFEEFQKEWNKQGASA